MDKGARAWTETVRADSGWFDLRLRELWAYRDLVLLFVRRDFVSLYKQTILGPLWLVLQPVLTTLAFTVVFGNFAGLSTDGLPHMAFYLCGLVAWRYFADCLTRTADTFVSSAGLFGKVYFPRLAVPVSRVVSGLFTLGIQFALFLAVCAWFMASGAPIRPRPEALLAPLLVLLMAVQGLGLGIIVSSMTTKYRDLRFLISFGVQLLMYLTPVIYPVSLVPAQYRELAMLNPVAPVIEALRYGFLGQGAFSPAHLGLSAAVSLALLLLGLVLFNRVEKTFMDTV
ncbi:ABC transporter permease [Desulfocurvus sp.]|jgi:lipopolysaccharide transport system permease protein|uniref:ABC transporter permease n=1 Tax=Desulfocurvus sp. TaxID=2871698 RepID=UPI0025C338F0|nr:ABC transporter permease [Desulfocurvus sp.]MCK9238800.1 ABC transporter permease [Desulfocurvus sp.]